MDLRLIGDIVDQITPGRIFLEGITEFPCGGDTPISSCRISLPDVFSIGRKRPKKSEGGAGSSSVTKRKLSDEQVKLVEQNFGSEHKLESERKDRLATEPGLDPRQVAVWFQNRRSRRKNQRLEEEYARLKSIPRDHRPASLSAPSKKRYDSS
ncbi:hypothetical protein SAY87_029067 [Trapa incisa]|uniref:Homeobox-leucine zipper protein n=1 Tax=Trapa incisa TaxID=236973 RepID=A0AAN7QS85_9MYRT|nr:hypothetical protein SAY87_029067 [Trapa incisa]